MTATEIYRYLMLNPGSYIYLPGNRNGIEMYTFYTLADRDGKTVASIPKTVVNRLMWSKLVGYKLDGKIILRNPY